jgi:MFS family permease
LADIVHPAPIEHETKNKLGGWWLVALLMATSLISYVNRVSMATAGDTRIMAQYEISPVRMGTVYSAFLFTYTLCMLPGGLFIDRVGPSRALLTVAMGSSVFVALTGVVGLSTRDGATAYLALLLVRGVLGTVSAPLYPACAAAVGQFVPAENRTRANGLVNGSALIGVAISPPLFGALIDRLDWPAAFLIAACFTLILALVWLAFAGGNPTRQATADERVDPSSWWLLLKNRGLSWLTLSYAAVGYFQYLFFYWMDYYFKTVLELPESRSRTYAAIPPLAMAVGMPLGGWLTDQLEQSMGARHGRRIIPMLGMLLGGVFLIFGVFATDPRWIVTWFALALGAVGTAEGAFWVTAIELGGPRGGSYAGFLNTGGNVGGLLAPVLTPWIGVHYGWGYAVGLGALICLLGVLFWLGVEIGESSPDSTKTAEPGHFDT